jgi:stage V sporulation protein R
LTAWQKEIVRIVRNVAEYFHPQMQTKVMNEGCATWTHYNIINKMYNKGLIADGAMLEFIRSHVGVTWQPEFDSPYFSGINPYALGVAMMDDIVRICDEPTKEDKYWFPNIAGCGDHFNVLKDIWANYRDESFIRQFLSPAVIRKFRFFSLENEQKNHHHYTVKDIHNEKGYEMIREQLANEYDIACNTPEINIIDADMQNDRSLVINYDPTIQGKNLHKDDMERTMIHLANLWGYDVTLIVGQPESYTDGDFNSKVYTANPVYDFTLETKDLTDFDIII